MTIRPYVGVTGITTESEAVEALKIFNELGFTMESQHVPMVACLLTSKAPMKSIIKRYPSKEAVRDAFAAVHDKAFTMIHYAPKNAEDTAKEIIVLLKQMKEGSCKAVQVNAPFPDINELHKVKREFSQIELVLQLGPEVTETRSDSQVMDHIAIYKDVISHILIDPSCGQGKEFEARRSIELSKQIIDLFPHITLGFAGGLKSSNVNKKIGKIIAGLKRSDFSIDVESGVRDKNEDLDLSKVRDYITEAKEVLTNKTT